MKKEYWYILITAVILLIIVFRKQIMNFFKINTTVILSPLVTLADGSPCSTSGRGKADGIIVKGICQPLPVTTITTANSVKIIDQAGAYALDIDATGCLAMKSPPILVPSGDTKPILEVKNNYAGCAALAPATPTIVRTSDGWFSTLGNSIQII